MQSIADSTGSTAAVEEAYNAMAWIHAVGDCHSPTESQFTKTVLQGLKRSLTKPVVKTLPVIPEMLAAIVEDAKRSRSLADLRLAAVCVASFAAFLRSDELVHIRTVDIKLNRDFMSIYITRSKTDQLHKGDEVVVARTNSKLCPV